MSNLPPIGSLWLHRESGERRFVTLHSRLGDNTYIGFNEVGLITYRLAAPEKWLSWAAHADRIDQGGGVRLSALGVFIGVCPEWDGPRQRWLCVSFGKCGHWRSMSVHDCEASAIKARSKLYRHHRNLNAEREMRRSKRSRTKTADQAPQGREGQQ